MLDFNVFIYHLYPHLNWQTKTNFRLTNSFICQLIDQSKTALFLRAPQSNREITDEKVLPNLIEKYLHIQTLGLSGFTKAHEKALTSLSRKLKTAHLKNFTSLNFSNMHLGNNNHFFEQISSQNILEITYLQTNSLVKPDIIFKQLATLFNTNQNLETFNLTIKCHRDPPLIPLSSCKNLKRFSHSGSDEIKTQTLESLAQCEKLKEVSFKNESNKTVANLKKFLSKEIAKKITHLEIALKGKAPISPCCLKNNNLSNLQFLNIHHQYTLSDSELLKISDISKNLKGIILDVQLISENAFATFILKLPGLEKLGLTCHKESSYFLEMLAKCTLISTLKLKGGVFTTTSLISFVQDHKELKYLNIKNILTNFNKKEYAIFISLCHSLNFLNLEKVAAKEDKKKKMYYFSRPEVLPKRSFYTI